MNVAHRRLPHYYAIGHPLFVTFRLHGSLPRGRHFAAGFQTSGEAFVALDRLLDRETEGPLFLKMPAIAEIVEKAIEQGSPELYSLHTWVIMPNHVHILLTPLMDPSTILKQLKGVTAREANQHLNRQGNPFWQRESYDRLVRDPPELRRIERYILLNPVRAGLAGSPEQYRWSSACVEREGGLKSAAS